jgi:predicted dinucleotide-binding enzyme
MVSMALANGLHRHGYTIMVGTNDPGKHDEIREKTNGQVAIGAFSDVADFSDLLILAVKGRVAGEALMKMGIASLKNKIVLDATNPIADGPPIHGVLPFFTSLDESLMEQLQRIAPDTHFVKCFSIVGNALMVDPDFNGVKPTMFICGNNDKAKQVATDLLTEIGWETEDMGKVEAARAIEPLCMLWCIPGINQGQWRHAFKLLR